MATEYPRTLTFKSRPAIVRYLDAAMSLRLPFSLDASRLEVLVRSTSEFNKLRARSSARKGRGNGKTKR